MAKNRRRRIPDCIVVLVGEGPNDIGLEGSFDKKKPETPGVLDTLVRTVAGEELRLEFRRRRFTQFSKTPVAEAEHHVEKAAAGALAMALQEGANVLVFSHDCDGESPSTLRDAAERGFEGYVQEHPDAQSIVRLAAFPRRMIESWLLWQPEAFERAFGAPKNRSFRFPKDVESLHGQKGDPDSNYPKQVLRRALEAYGRVPSTDTRVNVVENLDLTRRLSGVPTLADFVTSTSEQANECRARRLSSEG